MQWWMMDFLVFLKFRNPLSIFLRASVLLGPRPSTEGGLHSHQDVVYGALRSHVRQEYAFESPALIVMLNSFDELLLEFPACFLKGHGRSLFDPVPSALQVEWSQHRIWILRSRRFLWLCLRVRRLFPESLSPGCRWLPVGLPEGRGSHPRR